MITRVRARSPGMERVDFLPSRRVEPTRFRPATSTAGRAPSPSPSSTRTQRAPGAESAASESVRRYLLDVDQQRAQLDRAIQQAMSGRTFSPAELCALQLRVYQYGENLEVFSHLLERAVSAVKSTLNTQV
jgi:hypothetical protein